MRGGGGGDDVDAFVQKLELDESAIMEVSLCDNSKFVAFITKKFKLKIIFQYRWHPICYSEDP